MVRPPDLHAVLFALPVVWLVRRPREEVLGRRGGGAETAGVRARLQTQIPSAGLKPLTAGVPSV